MTWQIYIQALIKSFPLGIIIITLAIFGLYEAIETKWERRGKEVS